MSPRTNKHEKGPLYEWERLGIQPPPALKKVHAVRHNSSDGREPSQPYNQQEASRMSNQQTAEQIQQPQNNNPQPAAPAQSPAPAAQEPSVLVEVNPQGTTARDLNLNVTVKAEQKPEMTKTERAIEVGKKVGIIALSILAAKVAEEGAKAAYSYVTGGDSAPPVEG